MLRITNHIQIPEDELALSFARSGGPGGQNVNKVSSKVLLRWPVLASMALPPDVKARLVARLGPRLTREGELLITSQRSRDQSANIEDCRQKLRELILRVVEPPRPRKRTRPSQGSKLRRLAGKKRRSQTKAARRTPTQD